MSHVDFRKSNVTVTGGTGFLGAVVCEELRARGVAQDRLFVPSRPRYDLRRLDDALAATRGRDVVIHLAAHVGGIGYARAHPGEHFYDNMQLGLSVVEACRQNGVKKLVAVGSVCAYPKFAPAPFKEDDLWNGAPEESNGPYGIAKRALSTMTQAYRQQYGMNAVYLLPVNLYGPGDDFSPESSHVIPALIRKFIEARERGIDEVEVWGTGRATREFLYVRDAARAVVMAAERYDDGAPVNIGNGSEISIKALTELIAGLVGYEGRICWDASKPDGQPRRLLDVERAKAFGFVAETNLAAGLKETIRWYQSARAVVA